MTRTIWLASYPKSGNTWFRMLLANLAATETPVDINRLPERSGIASAREPLDYLTLIDSGLLTHDEADGLRPRVYEALRRGEQDDEHDAAMQLQPVRFVKCHDAYTQTTSGEALLGGAGGADGAIVIVRDPRDVAPSLANFHRSTVDAAIRTMADPRQCYADASDRQLPQLRQPLLTWSGHVESWLDQTDIPTLLVRYEDMQSDTAGTLRRALDFGGRTASDDAIARAVAFSHFSELKRQESASGFGEAPRNMEGAFFRRGEAGAWRDELTIEQVVRIEEAHGPTMRRLGYPLASIPPVARACA